jgi:hypothetical protein
VISHPSQDTIVLSVTNSIKSKKSIYISLKAIYPQKGTNSLVHSIYIVYISVDSINHKLIHIPFNGDYKEIKWKSDNIGLERFPVFVKQIEETYFLSDLLRFPFDRKVLVPSYKLPFVYKEDSQELSFHQRNAIIFRESYIDAAYNVWLKSVTHNSWLVRRRII